MKCVNIDLPPLRKYPIYMAYDIDVNLINSELQLRLEQARAILLLFDTKLDIDDIPDYAILKEFSRINPPLYIGNYDEEEHADIAKQFADQIAKRSSQFNSQFNSQFGIEQEHEILELKDLPLLQ